jgi:hypothetical protein
MPRAQLAVAVATVVAGVAVVASTLASGGHHRTLVAAPSSAGVRTAPAPVATTSTTSAAALKTHAAPTTVVARTPPPTTAPPTSWQPDAVLAAAMPSQSELGAGWAVVSPPANAAGSPSTGGSCAADPLPYADTGVDVGVAFDEGSHQATGTVTLYRVGSAAAMTQEHDFTASPLVLLCLDASAARDAQRYSWLGELEGTEFTNARAQVAVREPGDAALLTVNVTINGSSQSAVWAFVHQYVGRYEALTAVSWCSCKPLRTSDLQHLVNASAASVARAAAKMP